MGLLKGPPLLHLTGGFFMGGIFTFYYHKYVEEKRIMALSNLHQTNFERLGKINDYLMRLTKEETTEVPSSKN